MISDEVIRYRKNYLESNGWTVDYICEAGGRVFKKYNGIIGIFPYDTIEYNVIQYNYYSFFPYGGKEF